MNRQSLHGREGSVTESLTVRWSSPAKMAQSSVASVALPPWVPLFACMLLAQQVELAAQVAYRVVRAENFRTEPSPRGNLLAAVREGAEVRGGDARDGWVEIHLEGWIWGASLGPDPSGARDLTVAARGGENLRAGPNGRVLARLERGCLLDELARNGDWIQVRRTGWMWGRSLTRAAGGAGDAPTVASAVDREANGEGTLDWAVTSTSAAFTRTPDTTSSMTLDPETPVRVLARSGEWVRVRVEGWVREEELRPAAAGVLVGVTGAEVRASPGEFEGKMIRWTVQYLSLPTADELRPEIPRGKRYMLARGPMPEAGFVYVMLTPAQLQEIERLAPLAQLLIVARVRSARSRYLGNPLVELVDMSVRKP